MSENIINVIITGIFSLLGAGISAWATVKAAEKKAGQTSVNRNPVLFVLVAAVIGGLIGFLIGSFFTSFAISPAKNSDEVFCPFVTRNQIEELKNIQNVQVAIDKAEEFAGYRQNDYGKGSMIPTGVLIATDLQSSNLEQFPVIPVNNQGGWGLFLTRQEFDAPNAGTYWCIK